MHFKICEFSDACRELFFEHNRRIVDDERRREADNKEETSKSVERNIFHRWNNLLRCLWGNFNESFFVTYFKNLNARVDVSMFCWLMIFNVNVLF